jgi:lipopolysaccharide transport system ATP-binding protein
MEPEIAVSVEHLSKKYLIGKQKSDSLRGTLTSLFLAKPKDTAEEFWALKDVNFKIKKGDVVGIVGRNGAGKSTLLKLLSQITKPTEGVIRINGRVSSLLEVGTGFHHELTGRENIYLNGTILGMTREEVKLKFDEIVAFSGINDFIDTPVKYYSSGMYVRLAFAVAAHLEPEILIIDEVLAVGDADFQKKCLGKMQDVAGQGRTVLFVSHDIEAVQALCNKGILLEKGTVKQCGMIQDIIHTYTNNFENSSKFWNLNNRPGDATVAMNYVKLINELHQQVKFSHLDEVVGIEIEYEVLQDAVFPSPNFHVLSNTNILCFVLITDEKKHDKGTYKCICWIPKNLLNNQIYRIGVAITTLKTMEIHLYEKEVISLEIVESKLDREIDFGGHIPGIFRIPVKSEIHKL